MNELNPETNAGLPCYCSLVTVIEEQLTSKPPLPEPEKNFAYDKWAQDVEAYASTVLQSLVGEAREEVETIFDALQSHLKTSAVMARRMPSMRYWRANTSFQEVSEAITALHDHGVENTQMLENIEQELGAWLEEQERKRPPGGPAPPPV